MVRVDDVHAVALHPRHPVALALDLQVGHRGVALERGPHAEAVVRDHEDDGQAPQRREVHRLAERSLVGGTVAELADRRVVVAQVVGGEAEARRDRQVAADDPVAAHEAPRQVEHVHRAAAAVAEAVDAAEQLGHDLPRRGAARDRLAVRAVGRDQVVGVAHRAHRSDHRGLFADRQVQEAADLRAGVLLAGALLEMPDEQHGREPLAGYVGVRERVVDHVPAH